MTNSSKFKPGDLLRASRKYVSNDRYESANYFLKQCGNKVVSVSKCGGFVRVSGRPDDGYAAECFEKLNKTLENK